MVGRLLYSSDFSLDILNVITCVPLNESNIKSILKFSKRELYEKIITTTLSENKILNPAMIGNITVYSCRFSKITLENSITVQG